MSSLHIIIIYHFFYDIVWLYIHTRHSRGGCTKVSREAPRHKFTVFIDKLLPFTVIQIKIYMYKVVSPAFNYVLCIAWPIDTLQI